MVDLTVATYTILNILNINIKKVLYIYVQKRACPYTFSQDCKPNLNSMPLKISEVAKARLQILYTYRLL